ncbi:hypothetical protein JOS77_06595 [Chromobacterium haemolyticum]|nr:hypothetical protein JOS77_06595 [Chromobacterium haemolyticum]
MAIDLTRLPAPAVIEPLDYETLLAQYKAKLLQLAPAELRDSLAASLQLESESLTLFLELAAYLDLLQRQRINEAAKASLLAYAAGTDLDNRAADYGVQRLLIQPANPDANPPTEAIWESDDALRSRAQMALEGLSVARQPRRVCVPHPTRQRRHRRNLHRQPDLPRHHHGTSHCRPTARRRHRTVLRLLRRRPGPPAAR